MTPSPIQVFPYKGLMPYDEADAAFFFGRDAEREIITANLISSRLTLLYGPSGVGKSSVLRAGVAHHLRERAQQNLTQRGEREFAVAVFSSWRDDPVNGLLASLAAEIGVPRSLPENGFLKNLRALTELVGGDWLIILDQFEEYFLYHANEDGDGTFAHEFPRALSDPNLRVNFLLSIREDALAKLDRFEGRIPKLFDNYLRVEHLSRDAARAAIEQPIAQYNRRVADDERVSIEPELVEAVLDQVQTGRVVLGEAGRGVVDSQDGAAQIETPFLQLVMTRLWNEETGARPDIDMRFGGDGASLTPKPKERILRLDTLNRLGGAERIVRTHLDTTMNGLPGEERDAAARVFNFLVTPSGTKIAHTARDLAEYANVKETQLTPVLEKLTSASVRILRPVAPPPDQLNAPQRYEIFHDVLAPAMLDWRVRYAERQKQTETERRLAVERRRVTRLRLGLIGVSLALLGMIALAIFALQQRDAATRAQAESVVQRDAAQKANAETVIQRDAAQKAQADAIAQRDIAENERRIAFARELSVNSVSNLEIDPERSILLALQAVSVSSAGGKPVLREAEEALHRAVITSRVQLTLRGHAERVFGVAFSPDGTRLATGGNDKTAKIWDAATGKELLTLSGHTGSVFDVAFSPDGTRLVTGSSDKTAKLWDVSTTLNTGSATGKELFTLIGHTDWVWGVAFSPDGTRVATSSGVINTDSKDSTAKVWDATTGKELLTLTGHTGGVITVKFSPDGRRLATASSDKTVKLWDAATGKELLTLTGHTQEVRSVAFSPDGKRLATASADYTTKMWDVSSGQLLMTLTSQTGIIRSVTFSPDGTRLGTSGTDGTARVWDAATGQLVQTLVGHTAGVWRISFSPDGTRVATASDDLTVKVWDVSPSGSREWLTLAANPTGLVTSVAYSSDGRRIATASGAGVDKTAKVWDAVTGKELLALAGHTDELRSVAFSPDGKRLVTTSNDKTAKVWDAVTGKEIFTLPTQVERDVFGPKAVFSPDGQRIATSGAGGTVKVWDAATGKELLTFSAKTTHVYVVAFSPDGQRIATGNSSPDYTAQIWDAQTGRELLTLSGHKSSVYAVPFSPDGMRLATGSVDGTTKVWDAVTGKLLETLTVNSIVYDVAFSPDGMRLATASVDWAVKVWNVSPGREASEQPLTLYGFTNVATGVAFSPDGKRLATSSRDGTARVYALPLEDIVAIAKSRVTRTLTTDECQKYLHVEQCPP